MRRIVYSRSANGTDPGVFKEIKEKMGCEVTAKLVAQYGGTTIYIPQKIKIEHPLCQLLGREISQQLSSEFGGLLVDINREVAEERARRNKMIREDHAAGMSQREAALKYKLTTRHIREITNS
jgi:Mor family transcriptional regulator